MHQRDGLTGTHDQNTNSTNWSCGNDRGEACGTDHASATFDVNFRAEVPKIRTIEYYLLYLR